MQPPDPHFTQQWRTPISGRAPLGQTSSAARGRWPVPVQFPEGMRLLDRLRYAIRARQYSYKTELAYVYWAREFIRFNNRAHPADMGGNEVRRFVDNLAVQKHCAAATFRQAMSALVFLYSQVVGKELPWIEGLVTPKRPARTPVVLSSDEVARLLAQMEGTLRLMAELMYGTGMRLNECLSLRVKDLDLDLDLERREVIARQAKGKKGSSRVSANSVDRAFESTFAAHPGTLDLRSRAEVAGRLHARCLGSQVSQCQSRVVLVLGLSVAQTCRRSAFASASATSPARASVFTRFEKGKSAG